MKSFKCVINFSAAFFITIAIAAVNRPCPAETLSPVYSVGTGKIFLYSGEAVMVVPVAGIIEASCSGDGLIYYLSYRVEKGDVSRFLGCIDPRSGEVRYEKKIMPGMDNYVPGKIMAAGGVVSLGAVQREAPSSAGVLLQIKTDTMETSRRNDVFDFWAVEGDTIVVEKRETGICATAGGISVPVTVAGDPRIDRFLDGRLLFITNGRETEIIDIRAGKSLYQYSAGAGLLEPDDYTLSVLAVDETAMADDRDMIFYRVFVNGVESGRTDTGPGGVQKEFKVKLEPDRGYIVRLERWRLNNGKGKYERVNNVRQPAPVQIFIPGKRVIRLTVRFNGKEYSSHVGPAYK